MLYFSDIISSTTCIGKYLFFCVNYLLPIITYCTGPDSTTRLRIPPIRHARTGSDAKFPSDDLGPGYHRLELRTRHDTRFLAECTIPCQRQFAWVDHPQESAGPFCYV